jgi:hypothetical protein
MDLCNCTARGFLLPVAQLQMHRLRGSESSAPYRGCLEKPRGTPLPVVSYTLSETVPSGLGDHTQCLPESAPCGSTHEAGACLQVLRRLS